MVRIVHLTDFHLNPRNLRDWQHYVKKPMIKKLTELNELHKIAFIAFTGDMIDKGGVDYSSATEGFILFETEVVNPLLEALNLPINKFFIIPGNHDIVRSMDSERDELGSKEYFKDRTKLLDFMAESLKK